jgi:hypothetical protein
VTLPQVALSGWLTVLLITQPGSDLANEVYVLFNFGVWCSHAFEAMIFFMNLAFNKLLRAELILILRGVRDSTRRHSVQALSAWSTTQQCNRIIPRHRTNYH